MPIREMPAFVFSHKHVLRAVICALLSCFFLIAELFLMKSSVIGIVFDVVIPFTAAVTFGCYAITMAMDRPFILICPPMVYFLSLLINQLFSVEVGVEETYPIFVCLELFPALFYCISVATGTLKKPTEVILKIGCVVLVLTCIVLLILAMVFRIMLFSRVSQTFAQVTALLSVLCIYLGMLEQLKIAGCEKRQRLKKSRIFF